jgi:chitin disaccharide deacetylase
MTQASSRRLIVNADDFGQSAGVTRGIIEAHERGIVTSTSLMVRWPGAKEAASYARAHPALGVGLHLDLGEWTCQDGEWVPLYEVVAAGDRGQVAAETDRQLAQFRSLMQCDPTHIDSHQHVHRDEPARSVAMAIARALGVPLRHFDDAIAYCGDFYGQTEESAPYPEGVSPERLLSLIAALPEGVTELACHPGYATDLDTLYRDERMHELRSLCDGSVREAIVRAGIQLCSFGSLKRALR